MVVASAAVVAVAAAVVVVASAASVSAAFEFLFVANELLGFFSLKGFSALFVSFV